MSVEIIGKLFPCAMSFDAVRGKSGAVLTKAELAGLLAKLSTHEMNFALAKYGCDDGAKHKLLNNIIAYTTELALRHEWKPRNRDLLAGMARLAVYECLGDLRCSKCHGTGLLSPVRVCKCCDGIGHKRLSGREMAMAVGVDQAQWLRVWATRYSFVFDYVTGLDVTVKRIIKDASAINIGIYN